MDPVTKELFGKFPRAVGSPEQHIVHSEEEFDAWLDVCGGNNNVYSTISHYGLEGTPLTDKVSLDFDSPMKESAFSETDADDEKIAKMRDRPALAEEVLGDVLEDAREVCRWTKAHNVPCLSVFSGFGFHVHLLYQTEVKAEQKIISTAVMLSEELGLDTLDRVPIGDVHRLMRIPNCQRTYEERPCNHFTVPFTVVEMCGMSIHEMLEASRGPRSVPVGYDRGEMQEYPEYAEKRRGEGVEQKPVETEVETVDENIEIFLEKTLQMPCMVQRILQPDPSQTVRFNASVLLFNCGMTPSQVQNIFAQIGWTNYDPEETERQLKQIYDRKYSDMSCSSLVKEELCVFNSEEERKKECPTYGWSGGSCEF